MRKLFCIFFFILLVGFYNYFYPQDLDNSKKITKLLVLKSKRQLIVYHNDSILKIYKISLGRQPSGAKHFRGDDKTPEGLYYINDKNPHSAYHLNLGISYPSTADIKYAQKFGKSAGGDIKIHGIKNGLGFVGKFHRLYDWTHGCIALTNKEIEELFNHVSIGTSIEIRK